MARMAQTMGIVSTAATASAAETAAGVDAAMAATILAVGTANNALGRFGRAFSRVGTSASRSMNKLERVITAGSAVVQIGVDRMIASAGGLSMIGPAIDNATAIATAALTRMVGAFQVAATELDIVVSANVGVD